jgi:GSH-dependent disulfide-bond oxidoreductase
MIELYTWTTPNGRKASIMLEEIGVPYIVRPINLAKNEQFNPAFLKISPNNKIPAIVDADAPGGPLAVFESGAILIYLAEKTGRLLAKEGAERYHALEWLNWQMGGIGPMFGQLGFFAVNSSDKAPLAITRFTEEGQRLLTVLDRQLQRSAYLAGENYTIADIAAYPWMLAATTFLGSVLGPSIEAMPAVKCWLKAIGEREAVKRGLAVPKV